MTRFALLAVLIAALALAACNGGSTTPAPSTKSFPVETSEFAFAPNAFTAKVGDAIAFVITNKGALEHNFVVFDPSGKEVARAAIQPGATGTVNVKPSIDGVFAIVCDVAGHTDAGMTGTLTVTK